MFAKVLTAIVSALNGVWELRGLVLVSVVGGLVSAFALELFFRLTPRFRWIAAIAFAVFVAFLSFYFFQLPGGPTPASPIPAPVPKLFADGHNWMLTEPLNYRVLQSNYVVGVPAGFVTDFASIPQLARAFIEPVGLQGKAAIVHDYLYWDQGCLREEADRIFWIAMRESHVSASNAELIYRAVREKGTDAWSSNAQERKSGLIRIVPPRFWDFGPDEEWTPFRLRVSSSVTDPVGRVASPAAGTPGVLRPAYCDAAKLMSGSP